MIVEIRIGNYVGDNRVVNKDVNLSHIVQCKIYKESSIMSPELLLQYIPEIVSYNYMHIALWQRYYYIKDIIMIPAGRCVIRAYEDVLMSNKDEIYRLSCNIIRQENMRNKLIVDDRYPAEIMSTLTTIKFNRSPFNVDNGYNVVMGVIGGKSNDT